MKIECDESLFHEAFKEAFESYFASGKFDPPMEFYELLIPSFTKIMQNVVDNENREKWITEIMKRGLLDLNNYIIECEVFDRLAYLESKIKGLETTRKVIPKRKLTK